MKGHCKLRRRHLLPQPSSQRLQVSLLQEQRKMTNFDLFVANALVFLHFSTVEKWRVSHIKYLLMGNRLTVLQAPKNPRIRLFKAFSNIVPSPSDLCVAVTNAWRAWVGCRGEMWPFSWSAQCTNKQMDIRMTHEKIIKEEGMEISKKALVKGGIGNWDSNNKFWYVAEGLTKL